jgi:hypothetical protein
MYVPRVTQTPESMKVIRFPATDTPCETAPSPGTMYCIVEHGLLAAAALEDPPPGLAELRGVLMRDREQPFPSGSVALLKPDVCIKHGAFGSRMLLFAAVIGRQNRLPKPKARRRAPPGA